MVLPGREQRTRAGVPPYHGQNIKNGMNSAAAINNDENSGRDGNPTSAGTTSGVEQIPVPRYGTAGLKGQAYKPLVLIPDALPQMEIAYVAYPSERSND